MPDSSITKQAFASALKDLMQEMPFDKIRVSHICDKCNMNRQSFYYHFQDKYELMNWIFDMEFIEFIQRGDKDISIEEMMALFRILYDNRAFYRNALSVQGQNSLSDHIRELALPILQSKLKEALSENEDSGFYVEFFIDALLWAIIRWIRDENCEPPEKFIPHFFSCILATAKYIMKKYDD